MKNNNFQIEDFIEKQACVLSYLKDIIEECFTNIFETDFEVANELFNKHLSKILSEGEQPYMSLRDITKETVKMVENATETTQSATVELKNKNRMRLDRKRRNKNENN